MNPRRAARVLLTSLVLGGSLLAAAQPKPGGAHPVQDPDAPNLTKPGEPKAPPPPTDAQCTVLPPLKMPPAFGPGETLTYDLDALGVKAGTMVMRVLPVDPEKNVLPLEVKVQTNTFFSKIRRVSGTAVSELNPRSLRPRRYTEDTTENEIKRSVDVGFDDRSHTVDIRYVVSGNKGEKVFRYAHDGLDNAGAIHLLRQLPFKKDLPLCIDVYGIRRLWRVTGKVLGREHVSLPIGEFEAWHIQGLAVRMDDFRQRREVHAWISDDARRLPLVAMGAIDLGVVRATLTAFQRPHEKGKARKDGELSW